MIARDGFREPRLPETPFARNSAGKKWELTSTFAVPKPLHAKSVHASGSFSVSQVQFRRKEEEASGLRMRKKLRTHASIVEAAFSLFEEQGFEDTTVEQIAERADISTTTFFRYFPTKVDLVICGGQDQLPLLAKMVVDRPSEENDFVAIREAILDIWIPEIDPGPTVCAAHAVLHSPTLRGIYENISRGWVVAVCDALAQRHGLADADQRCRAVARIALGTFGAAVESWVADKCKGDLAALIREEFALAIDLCCHSPNSAKPTSA